MDFNKQDALNVAASGALKLGALTQEDGSFRYRYDQTSGRDFGGYNILRHAGAIWAMIDVYSTTRDPALLTSARRAATRLLNKNLRFYRSHTNMCIRENNAIKLGGNALAAIALLSLYKEVGDSNLLAVAHGLCRFIIDQRAKHGEFVHKRYYRSGKISSFRSSYYVGEALLALMLCYEATGDALLLNAVVEAERQLAKTDYGVREQSHWMLYSLQKLQEHHDDPMIYLHAEKIAKDILDRPKYLSWNRSTPTACRSEGLLAFLRMDEKDSGEQGLRQRVSKQIVANLQSQLSFFQHDGAFVQGGETKRPSEVRIDYIQHNISAFLHAYRQLPESHAKESKS